MIKQNINKIDSDLKKLFENVYIAEKADKGCFYIEISANKMFLFEGCKKRIEVKTFINKDDLRTNKIKWSYSVNPLNESSERINRTSIIDKIANDIYDIASNKRMVNEYFDNLESHVDLILENNNNIVKVSFSDIVKKYDKTLKDVIIGKNYMELCLNENLKVSDKFNIERELLALEKVNYISFNNNNVKITFK